MDNQAFERDLRKIGINPNNIGKTYGTLPPIPSSDAMSLQRNSYNGFYKYGAKEFWQESEITQNQVQDFKKCQHHLMKVNNEAQCTRCHIGWLIPPTWDVQDGKLFDGETQLQFAL